VKFVSDCKVSASRLCRVSQREIGNKKEVGDWAWLSIFLLFLLFRDNMYVMRLNSCIKPNPQKKASTFDNELIRHQVRYLGLLENVRIRRAGTVFFFFFFDVVL